MIDVSDELAAIFDRPPKVARSLPDLADHVAKGLDQVKRSGDWAVRTRARTTTIRTAVVTAAQRQIGRRFWLADDRYKSMILLRMMLSEGYSQPGLS